MYNLFFVFLVSSGVQVVMIAQLLLQQNRQDRPHGDREKWFKGTLLFLRQCATEEMLKIKSNCQLLRIKATMRQRKS